MENAGEKPFCSVCFSEHTHRFLGRAHWASPPVCCWRRGGGRLVIGQLPQFKSGGMSDAAVPDKQQLSGTWREETRRRPQTATSGSRSGTGEGGGEGVLCLLCSVFTWKKVGAVLRDEFVSW